MKGASWTGGVGGTPCLAIGISSLVREDLKNECGVSLPFTALACSPWGRKDQERLKAVA